MLKGQEWKTAIQFLRKHAAILGPTELNPSFSKVNGTVDEAAGLQLQPIGFLDDSADETTQNFRLLVRTLSTIRTIPDLDTDELVATFRSCKYQVNMTERSIAVLKAYLAKFSHVVIIQTLQIWFNIDTMEDKTNSEPEDEVMDDSFPGVGSGLNGFSSFDDLHETDISKFSTLLASPKTTPIKHPSEPRLPPATAIKVEVPPNCEEDTRLKSLQSVVERINTHRHPTQIYCVQNSNDFATADTDEGGCHLAAGFEDSTVVVWSTDRSVQCGRKPYAKSAFKSCDWSLLNTELEDDGVSSDEEQSYKKFRRKRDEEVFMAKRCSQNVA